MRFSTQFAIFIFSVTVANLARAGASGPISAGDQHTCALSSNSMVYCWGDNTFGQLGNGRPVGEAGSVQKLPRPVQVLNAAGDGPLRLMTDISAGSRHTCARLWISGSLLCWGDDTFGELGDGHPRNVASLPTFVLDRVSKAPIANAISIDAGEDDFSCALLYDAPRNLGNYSIACWGSGSDSQLGDNSYLDEDFPLPLAYPNSSMMQVSTGKLHACAIDEHRLVYCWGYQWGANWEEVIPEYVLSSSGTRFTDAEELALGDDFSCALMVDTTVFCWGYNAWGELGNGTGLSPSLFPVHVIDQSGAPLQKISAIAAGGRHACALKADTTVACWGENSAGQLGEGRQSGGELLPVQVVDSMGAPIRDIISIAAGTSHTCAMKLDASVLCWGANNSGQLGNGTFEGSNVALPVDFETIFANGFDGA